MSEEAIKGNKGYIKRISLGLLALVVMMLIMIYVPFVQRWAKDVICTKVSEATGWEVTIGDLRLRFPLSLSVSDVLVLDENRDTMVVAEGAKLDVKFWPLLRKHIEVEGAEVTGAAYSMTSSDSSLVMQANVQSVKLDMAQIVLSRDSVALGDAVARGGDIVLHYYPEKAEETAPDSTSSAWKIAARSIALRDVRYRMSMLPTIDSMDVNVHNAKLLNGYVNTELCRVKLQEMSVDSLDVKYFYPAVAEATAEQTKDAEAPAEASMPWTVTAAKLNLTNSRALYALKDAKPADGLDMNYLEISDVNFEIDSLYNRGMAVTVPLKSLSATERCGLQITAAHGVFDMDSTVMAIKNFDIRTLLSEIKADGKMGMRAFEAPYDGDITLTADALIDVVDIEKMFPIYKSYLRTIPRHHPLQLAARVDGTAKTLNVEKLRAELPRYAYAEIKGRVNNVTDSDNLGGDLAILGRFDNINFIKPSVLDAEMGKQVHFPPMTVKGKAALHGTNMSGNLDLALATGKTVGNAKFNTASNAYDVAMEMQTMPLHALMPLSAFGDVTARLKVSGRGFDIMKPKTILNATIDVDHLHYGDTDYRNMVCNVNLHDGQFDASIDSENENCDFTLQCGGELKADHYVVAMDCDVRDLNLHELRLSDVALGGSGTLKAFGDVNLATMECDVIAEMQSIKVQYDTISLSSPSMTLAFESSDSTINARLDNEDLSVDFSSEVGVKRFVEQIEQSKEVAMNQWQKISLNIDTLQAALPPFAFQLGMGKNGLVQQYLKQNQIEMRQLKFDLYNDSTIYGNGIVQRLDAMGTKIDTITAKLVQTGRYLGYSFHMGNRPGTMDNFASATLKGGVLNSRLTTIYDVKDIKERTGYHFGTHADLNDSVVKVNIFTPKPLIGYKEWQVNDDNYVLYDYKNKHFDANLLLEGGNSGTINLFTNHVEHGDHDDDDHGQEEVNLQVKNLKLEEWLMMFPFAPEMSGELTTDMQISYRGSQFWGEGKSTLKNFKYEGETVGDFDLNALMTLDPKTGNTNLESYMNVNGAKVMFAAGVLNDSTATSPMSLKLDIDKFPISTATAFIPNGIAELQGYLNGEMTMTGTMDKPIFTGHVVADNGAIFVPMFGSKILFPNTVIPVDSSVIHFNKYALMSCNDKPLVIDGYVDITNLNSSYVDLSIQGRGVQFVDSKQIKKSQLFGRGYADVSATAKGRMSELYVNADVALLSGSNLTYVLQDDVSEIVTETNPDMVHFVQFDDSLSLYGDSLLRNQDFGMSVNASVSLRQGNIINAYLSTDGKNRVQVQAQGTLNYRQGFAGDAQVTGRVTVDNGYVKYTPPLIKEVDFNVVEGSYIEFTGNMLNPKLNFEANEKYKATVSSDGGTSHLVDFLITCNVGGTLSQMDVSFDLSTNDDLTVQNELSAMSQQQRSAQAMNLMLYGSYMGSSKSSKVTNNALYSFLNAQLNSWAASAIKGVDLSLGINQYDRGAGSSTVTSYSYNLSKSLFNDRFKIVVGGNYSTDASAEDNFSENLISDISIEYLLNNSGSMYVRLFRHTGFESILEGEIIETGVGFVLKRKLSTLKHIFKFRPSRKAAARREKERQEQMKRLQGDSMALPEETVLKPVIQNNDEQKQ